MLNGTLLPHYVPYSFIMYIKNDQNICFSWRHLVYRFNKILINFLKHRVFGQMEWFKYWLYKLFMFVWACVWLLSTWHASISMKDLPFQFKFEKESFQRQKDMNSFWGLTCHIEFRWPNHLNESLCGCKSELTLDET